MEMHPYARKSPVRNRGLGCRVLVFFDIVNLLNLNLILLKQLVHETSTRMTQLCVKRL